MNPPLSYSPAAGRPVTVTGMDALVTRFVAAKLDVPAADLQPCTTIGVVLDDALIAGTVFYQYRANPHGGTIEVCFAAETPRWCTRRVLGALFAYPFRQIKVARLQAACARKNKKSRRLLEGLGFKMEGVCRRAWDGSLDAVLYSMLPEECRWIGDSDGL